MEEEKSPALQQVDKISAPPEHIKQHKSKKLFSKGFIIVILIILAIGIPFVVSFISIINPPPPPPPQKKPIALVENQPVYLTDIEKVALEKYPKNTINESALQEAYATLIERIILEKAAKKLNIFIFDEEIDEALTRSGVKPGKEISSLTKLDTKYELLRNKIIKKEVESREADSIGFYIVSFEEQQGQTLTQEQRELLQQQRKDAIIALTEIEIRLKEGEIPLTLARDIYKKYPSLQPVLAVNGYILKSTIDESFLMVPKLYTYKKENVGKPFFDAIYTMRFNEIKQVNEDDGAGGYVIWIRSINNSQIRTYEDWLAKQKKDLVKENVTL